MPDASATEDLVLYETKDRIATITINRPDKLNALSNGVVAQLQDAMLRLQASDDMCAIVTAAGDRAFSVGADLRDPPRDPQLWECMPGVGVDVDKPLVAASLRLLRRRRLLPRSVSATSQSLRRAPTFSIPKPRSVSAAA